MLPPLLIPLLLTLLILQIQPTHATTSMYLPLSYTIPFGTEQCLYERISHPNEHLTSSVFVLSGEQLSSAIVFEGPVAPVDLDTTSVKNSGGDLQKYLDRYEQEGMEMFTRGKYGDSMLNVKPVRIAEMVNFEEEEEDYYDDYYMTEKEREEFNEHHDREHQHMERDYHGAPEDDRVREQEERRQPRRRMPEDENEEEEGDMADDYIRMREVREEHLERMLDMEAEMDDDFVKLQLDRNIKKGKQEKEILDIPERRRIIKPKHNERQHKEDEEEEPPRRRLFGETPPELKLLPGEPYQRTILVASPGWYRLCVHGKSTEVTVEMELRKSSTFGKVDPRTGHVPSLEEVETHSEIRGLFEKEDDALVIAEESGIKEDDLRATKEQLRILEKVYADIITKQLEERRTWNWRTIKNQHLYSHLVLGNLVETIVYMGITGWQVYTIRKWFGGEPRLGR